MMVRDGPGQPAVAPPPRTPGTPLRRSWACPQEGAPMPLKSPSTSQSGSQGYAIAGPATLVPCGEGRAAHGHSVGVCAIHRLRNS